MNAKQSHTPGPWIVAGHDATKAEAFQLLAENARLKSDIAIYVRAFKHVHDATGDHPDICKQCGLNFRDQMHRRVGE